MRSVILLIGISSLSFAATQITDQQALTVIPIAQAIEQNSAQMENLANSVHVMFKNGQTYNIQGSTQTYIVTAQQTQDILLNYQNLKNNICSMQCSNLP